MDTDMSGIVRTARLIRSSEQESTADRPVSIIVLLFCRHLALVGGVWGHPSEESLKGSWRNSELPLAGEHSQSSLSLLLAAVRCPGNHKLILIKKKIPVKSHSSCVTQEAKSIPTISQTLLIWKSLPCPPSSDQPAMSVHSHRQ